MKPLNEQCTDFDKNAMGWIGITGECVASF